MIALWRRQRSGSVYLGKAQAAVKETPGLKRGRAFLCVGRLAAAEGEAEGGLLLRVGAGGKV